MRYSTIIEMGPPGVGKGTVGKIVVREFDKILSYAATGDLVRDAIADKRHPLGEHFRETISRGERVNDNMILDLLHHHLASNYRLSKKVILLDGYPRTVAQASAAGDFLDMRLVYLFDAPDEVCIRRIEGRIAEAKKQGKQRRDDDNPEALRKRIADYRVLAPAVVNYFLGSGVPVHPINASVDGASEVAESVIAHTGPFLKALGYKTN